ncbi:MAG: NDP-sugar synthase [Myxococcales bacterium]|jgi:mannose-1-phosphate guanylyltransferase|nr:NDP-sugar synthase [Myxococcales bacterium]
MNLGAICRSAMDPTPLLILDVPRGDASSEPLCEAIPWPASEVLDVESIQRPARVLTVLGQDLPAARTLAMRRRAARAFRAFEDAQTQPPSMSSGRVRTAMLLCAGLGTRLRPLTARLPKPAVPFFGAPLIRYSLALLQNAGIERVVINTHHLPDVMERVARNEAERLGLTLEVSREPALQDTAGGLRDARALIGRDAPFLLVNGDAFISIDLPELIARHRRSGAIASLAVVPPVPGESFRAIEADTSGRVARIRGIGPERVGLSPWHFLGVHVLESDIFDAIPGKGPCDINGEVYPSLIARGALVEALPVRVGAWADLGTPRRYIEACEELLTGLCDLAPLGAATPLNTGAISGAPGAHSFVDRSAVLERAVTLDGAIVGPDVHLGSGARIRRAVLLPGVQVAAGARVENALVWPLGHLPIDR